MGISHVAVTVTNFDESKQFYAKLMEHLGAGVFLDTKGAPHVNAEGRVVLFAAADFLFGLYEANPEHRGNKFDRYNVGLHHIAMAAPSREAVDQLHEKLVASGVNIESPPAEYPYVPGYYAVYFYDPDGMKLEYCYVPAG